MLNFFKWAIPGLFFFIFIFSELKLAHNYIQNIFMLMLGFEPWISGVGSDRFANSVTTTSLCIQNLSP